MYVKGLFEVYKILQRIGIKPKDIIGMGGDIVKMGKSLFNTRINPQLIKFIEKNQKIPTKILENIKLHARTLKNATESQKNLFLENIKSIQNAKTGIKPEIVPKKGMFDNIFTKMHREVMGPPKVVKPPATSDKGLAIIKKFARKEQLKKNLKKGDKTLPTHEAAEDAAGGIVARIQDVTGKSVSEVLKFIKSEKQLSKILDDWEYGAAMTKQSFKKPAEKVIEKVIDFKGWTPTVIKGCKDKLATGGIANHFRVR